jgi:hypothetical protein
MMKRFSLLTAVLILCALAFYLSSCKDKEHDPPGVTFNTSSPYIYDDTTITHGQIFTIYVQATEEALNDLLESGTFSTSINGRPDSVFQTMSFVSTQFNTGYAYTAGAAGTTQKFVFTFYTQNGVPGSDSLTLTYN